MISFHIIFFSTILKSYLVDTCTEIHPPNVTVSYNGPYFGGRYFLGATASASCAEGYELYGVSTVRCQPGRFWLYPISQFRCIPNEQS